MPKQQDLTAGFFSLMTLSLCFFAVGPVQAASGNGPYYAEPSWDQKLDPATRFVVLTNWNSEAVLDRETGLVWEQSPTTTLATPQNWFTARLACIDKTTGGRKGWRLPSMHELASLVDPNNSDPSLPTGHPFANVQTASHWSATTSAESPTLAWFVTFHSGFMGAATKTGSLQAWCVRGGNNADAY